MKFDIWVFFLKFVEKSQLPLKSEKNSGHCTCCPIYSVWSNLAQFFLEWEIFPTKLVQKIKASILCSMTFFPPSPLKSCRLWYNVEKYCRTGQTTDDNMAHAHCVLDIKGYKHTLRIFHTHCFSMATMVRRTRLNVTAYVPCLSCIVSD
jgi:hypothetical protein